MRRVTRPREELLKGMPIAETSPIKRETRLFSVYPRRVFSSFPVVRWYISSFVATIKARPLPSSPVHIRERSALLHFHILFILLKLEIELKSLFLYLRSSIFNQSISSCYVRIILFFLLPFGNYAVLHLLAFLLVYPSDRKPFDFGSLQKL